MKLNLIFWFSSLIFLSSCIPQSVKEKMDEGMKIGQQMLADQEFKKAMAYIELHKLRNGEYPKSLGQLEFLSAMDSSMFNFVEYYRLDTGYELNIVYKSFAFSGKEGSNIELNYPEEFWKGLGCIKSNAK